MGKEELDQALEVANGIKAIYVESGNKKKEAKAMLLLTTVYFAKGNFEDGLQMATEAQSLFMEMGDKKGEGIAWGIIRAVREATQEPDEALRASRTQSALLSLAGDRKAQAEALKTSARLFIAQGRPDEAVKVSNEALAMARTTDDLRIEVEMLTLVASSNLFAMTQAVERVGEKQKIKVLSKSMDRALRPAREAAALAKKVGDDYLRAIALFTVSQVHTVTGQYTAGIATAKDCKQLFEDIVDSQGAAHALCISAEAYFLSGDRQKAESEAQEAWNMFHELQDEMGEAKAGEIIGRVRSFQVAVVPTGGGGDGGTVSAGPGEVAKAATLDYATALEMAKRVALECIGSDEDVDLDSPLMDIGLDSLAAIGFREELISASSLPVPTSLVFDYPSLVAVADHLVELSKD